WDNMDWDNFSCVEMTRSIRNEMSAKFPTRDALYEHLVSRRSKAGEENSGKQSSLGKCFVEKSIN
ncbi:MAG: hypothetical protein LBH25_11715, partial [Fibromonadaceae bacterium]|nr:hypothetical protein [Fibromonadaceae bacterium]